MCVHCVHCKHYFHFPQKKDWTQPQVVPSYGI